MRYFNKPGFSFLLSLIFTGLAGVSQAQDNGTYDWKLGLGVGYTNYYGDVSNYRIRGLKDIDRIYRFAAYNKNYQHQPSFSLMMHKRLTPTLGFMIQVNHMQFEMSDRYRRNNGTFDTASQNFARSLNFRTTLQDAGIAFSFNGNNGRFFSETAFFYPSFWIGAGVSTFAVKGDLYDENGNPYNYRLPGNIMDGTYETTLRDLRTETDQRYSNVEPYADLGLALNFRFSQQVTLSVQSDIKYSGSDYLDDVSRKYRTSYANTQEAYAARPGYNVVNPISLQRGDDNSVNDFYVNNRLVLNISLGKKNKPQPFTSPVIYSLYPPRNYVNQRTDTLAAKSAARKDSLKVMQDSMARSSAVAARDTAIQKQLLSINTELTAIKSILRSQQAQPRLQRLQYQMDSISALRTRLAQRPAGREDQLRLRIYDLQADSLRHEMEKVQSGSQNATAADSAWSRSVQPVSGMVPFSAPAGSTTLRATDENAAAQDDSISTAELKTFNTDIRNLKRDKRYTSDAVFKSNVDSLQRKVSAYPVRSKNTKAPQKAAVQQTPPDQFSAVERTRMDSIQRRLAGLESRVSNSRAATTVTDTVFRNQAAPDSSINHQEINALNSRIRRNSDSLALLQQQLKRTNDSAAYFRRAAFAATQAQAEAAPKKKWYQKIFASKKNKQQDAQESVNEPLQLQRQPDSTAYYQRAGAAPATTPQAEIAPKRKWYQKIFGSRKSSRNDEADNLAREKKALQQQNDNLEKQLKQAEEADARNRKAAAAPSGKSREAEETAPKRKWYQKIFGSGKRKQQTTTQQSVTVRNDSSQRALQQQNEELRRRLKQSEDSAAYYQKALAAPSGNAGKAEAAPKRKWYQKIFGSGKRNRQDTAHADYTTGTSVDDAARNALEQRNADMQRQLNRTQDSIAYYRSALRAAGGELQAEEAPKKGLRKLFGSGKKKKKAASEQAVIYTPNGSYTPNATYAPAQPYAPATRQQYVDQQQVYYNDQTTRMQRSIDDLNRRNKTLADDLNRLQADRNRIGRNDLLTPPTVIADRSYDSYRASGSRNNSEISAMSSELDRLRTQVNDNTRRTTVNNLSQPVVPVQPVTGAAQVPVQTIVTSDTAHINTLRSEIDQLRSELNAIRNKPADVDTVIAAPKFDVNSFPVISVYFNTGAVALSNDQFSRLSPFAQAAAKNTEAGILLKGFTDPVGNPAANEALARKRTEYVRSVLVDRFNVQPGRIVVDEPSSAGGGKVKRANPLDRRVDLQFR